MSTDATFILQLITIIGSLIASLYATQRIIKWLLVDRQYSQKMYIAPALLLCLSTLALPPVGMTEIRQERRYVIKNRESMFRRFTTARRVP
jgi:hypothetical protein